MIGFFEHQYLSYKKNHLYNLIAVAKADGHFHENEEKLIYRIGEKYGLKDRQVASLIVSTRKRDIHIPEKHKDKMNQLYDLLLIVHADEIVDSSEVEFCENIAVHFGFDKAIVVWLLEYFKNEKRPDSIEWEEIIESSKKFINAV